MINSALKGTVVPDRIIVVDNGDQFDSKYTGSRERVEVLRPGKNLGVAGGWNLVMAEASDDDDVCIANDDVTIRPEGLEEMQRMLASEPEPSIVLAPSYSLFMLRTALYRLVGAFDHEFFPAYYEDNDYARRVDLAGLKTLRMDACSSHAGSATINSYNQHERNHFRIQFHANAMRYIKKWGNLPGKETFATPFNQPSEPLVK